jgi:hypothetical protein
VSCWLLGGNMGSGSLVVTWLGGEGGVMALGVMWRVVCVCVCVCDGRESVRTHHRCVLNWTAAPEGRMFDTASLRFEQVRTTMHKLAPPTTATPP